MARRSPLVGYNHNVRHLGRLFHVQTEDSGLLHAHLTTHVYFEGTVVASQRSDYDAAEPEPAVLARMQKQHKQVVRELCDGFYDLRIAKILEPG